MATKTPLAEYAGTFRVMASGDTIPAAIVPTLNQNTTGSAATLTTARTINGTSFNGSANITTASWGTSRTITIGSTGKAVNGSANVTWTLSEIGAPSTTGTGASGTWGISITGNASTATYLPPMAQYSKGETDLTTSYPSGLSSVFVQPANGWASYGTVTTAKGLSAGGGTLQLYAPYSEALGGKALRVRFGDYSNAGGAGWTGWKTVLQDDNFNDYAPTLTGTGASGTWGISITGSAATLTTARTLTIGSTGKSFNGSANVSWSLAEIGAIADAPSDGTTYGRKDAGWVAISSGGISDAPSDGKYYGRKDGAWEQVGQPGVVNVTANTTLSASHLNKVVEVTVAGTVTLTIPSGLGAQGDIITVVHSHATGTIYVQGAGGVGIYRFGSNTSQSITGIGMMSFYRCSASNTWLAA